MKKAYHYCAVGHTPGNTMYNDGIVTSDEDFQTVLDIVREYAKESFKKIDPSYMESPVITSFTCLGK